MEDAKRKSDRILGVERGYEWSRLEKDIMASAYEHVLPVARAAPGKSLAGQVKVDSNGRGRTTNGEERYATGA